MIPSIIAQGLNAIDLSGVGRRVVRPPDRSRG